MQTTLKKYSLGLIVTSALLGTSIAADSTSEIIYDNTTTPLYDNSTSPASERYADSKVELGDQLQLSGTARTVTDIYIEYYGNFTAQGDEKGRLRIYNNKNTYDLFRKSPTDVLFESDFFPVSPSFNTYALHNLNITVPDTITLGLEFSGLAENEDAGFLLYSPPTVGSSFNEFWRRTTVGGWEAFTYTLTDPTFKANASIRIVAYVAPIDLEVFVAGNELHLTWNSQGTTFQIERAPSAVGPFEIVGTTNEMSWSEPINPTEDAIYRVKRLL
jgi:hypothetical protein